MRNLPPGMKIMFGLGGADCSRWPKNPMLGSSKVIHCPGSRPPTQLYRNRVVFDMQFCGGKFIQNAGVIGVSRSKLGARLRYLKVAFRSLGRSSSVTHFL